MIRYGWVDNLQAYKHGAASCFPAQEAGSLRNMTLTFLGVLD